MKLPLGKVLGDRMHIEIRPANKETLRQYGTIPIVFEVRSILEPHPIEGGMGGIKLQEVELLEPYLWDIRVHPDVCGRGIGTGLFRPRSRLALPNLLSFSYVNGI